MSLITDQPTTVKLDDLVGEGKKFQTPDALAAAKVESDKFIAQLQRETAELRAELSARPTHDRTQEILDRMEALRAAPTTERQPEPMVTERVVETKGLSVEDVDRLLNEREKARLRTQNIELAKEELVKRFGPNYSDVLKTLAGKLQVSTDFLEQTAATSPQALLKLVDAEKQSSVFTPPSGSSATSFTPTGGVHNKASHYVKLREANRKEYLSLATQSKMYKDAMALGEEFYDVAI